MKLILATMLLTSIFSYSAHAEYEGSTFRDVWKQVISDPYENPQQKISYASLVKFFKSKIKAAANRTLSDRSDILPQFRKLAHPNGVCFAGKWVMTQENPYGGYFKKGSEALIIARASTAMNGTKKGEIRAMGLAGKIFPTLSETDQVKTASFFLVDDLGGTKIDHWSDAQLTNEPKTSKTLAVITHLFYALKLAITFGKADSNPGIRQVYMISELGAENPKKVLTPKWMMVQAAPGQTVDEADFRDELNIENYKNGLKLNVFAGDTKDKNGNVNFAKVGEIQVSESIVSNSCDHRLHFHHPKWRSDLNHLGDQ